MNDLAIEIEDEEPETELSDEALDRPDGDGKSCFSGASGGHKCHID